MQKKSVGLYIGNDSVSVIELKSLFGKVRVAKFACVTVPQKTTKEDKKKSGLISDSPLPGTDMMDDDGLGNELLAELESDPKVNAVRRAFEESGITSREVVTALPAEEVMVRYFQMPYLPKREWDSGVRFEAKKYIPFKMEDVVSDFMVTETDSKTNQMDIVFVAAKKDSVDAHLKLLERLELKPLAVEMVAFSLHRALFHQMADEGATLMVELNGHFANVTIVRNGLPFFTRDIPLSYQPKGDLDYSGMMGNQSAPLSQGQAADPLQPMYQNVLGEIRLSLDYYKKRFQSETITKALIVGTIELDDWSQVLQNELGIEFEIGRPMRFLAGQAALSPRLAVAGGLALRLLVREPYAINLSQGGYSVWDRQMLLPQVLVAEAVIACCLLLGIHFYTIRQITDLTQELHSQQRQLHSAGVEFIALGDIDRFVDRRLQLQKKLMRMTDLGKPFVVSTAIMTLSELIPEELWLTDIKLAHHPDTGRQVIMRGYSFAGNKTIEIERINTFLNNLKERLYGPKGFTRFTLISIERQVIEETEVTAFEMQLAGGGA